MIRSYDPTSKQWTMQEAMFDSDLPRWVDTPGVSMREGKGLPLISYLDMRQMKSFGVRYGIGRSDEVLWNFDIYLDVQPYTQQGGKP